MSVPDENNFRNASCELNYISTFTMLSPDISALEEY